MNYFENFRQQNQHLFGEDSDYSDTEPDFDPEENEEIEIIPSRRVVCEICENGEKNRTRIKCSRCRKFICSAHSEKLTHIVCVKCKK